MLRVIFGYPYEAYLNTYDVIGVDFDKSILEEDLPKRMIKKVDKTIVYSCTNLVSSILGNISYKDLSHGVCGLIILYAVGGIIPLEYMGDNCLEFLKEIVAYHEKKGNDVTVCVGYLRNLFLFGINEIFIVNSGKVVTTAMDYAIEYYNAEENYFKPYSIGERDKKLAKPVIDENLWGGLV